jgi:hypothetical protein
MAAIWHEIEIEWDGEVYTIKPTLDFINHLERKPGSSLSQFFIRAGSQDLPSGRACELVADALTWAGADRVTAEDVYAETAGFGGAVTIAMQILAACMPQPKESATPATTKKKPAPRAAKRTGANSTA